MSFFSKGAVIVVLAFLFGCRDKKQDIVRIVLPEDFMPVAVKCEAVGIHTPGYEYGIRVVDSVVFVTDMEGDYVFSAYDLRPGGGSADLIKSSDSMDRIALVQFIQVDFASNRMTLYDGQRCKMAVLTLDSLRGKAPQELVGMKSSKLLSIPGGCSGIVPLSNGNFAGLNNDRRVAERLTIFDGDGKVIKRVGNYFRSERDTFPDSGNSYAYTGDITAAGDRIVVTNKITDQIEFYDLEGNLLRVVRGPKGFAPEITMEVDEVPEATIMEFGLPRMADPYFVPEVNYKMNERSNEAYFIPRLIGDELWTIYMGTPVYREGRSVFPYTQILTYSKNGDPRRQILVNCYLYDFDVDPVTRTVYAVAQTAAGKTSVVRFSY